jgi:hypothetical protein
LINISDLAQDLDRYTEHIVVFPGSWQTYWTCVIGPRILADKYVAQSLSSIHQILYINVWLGYGLKTWHMGTLQTRLYVIFRISLGHLWFSSIFMGENICKGGWIDDFSIFVGLYSEFPWHIVFHHVHRGHSDNGVYWWYDRVLGCSEGRGGEGVSITIQNCN